MIRDAFPRYCCVPVDITKPPAPDDRIGRSVTSSHSFELRGPGLDINAQQSRGALALLAAILINPLHGRVPPACVIFHHLFIRHPFRPLHRYTGLDGLYY